ncbi:MAG: efflux RND transporter periplasmic adaptor subunit [Chryseolinea sp.]
MIKRILNIRLAIFLPALIIAVACQHKPEAVTETNSVPTVEMTLVRSLQPSIPIVLPGELKAWNKTNIVAKVKGYVGKVSVDRGALVRKGQTLAVLEAPEVVAELNHAKARAASAHASVIEQRAKRQASRLTYKRIVETSKTDGAVSANEMDMAYARMMADSALAEAASQNLQAAEAQLVSQSQLVNYLEVRAPFDGTITERNISPGDLVGSESAKPLFILEDRSKLRLTIAVPENLSNSIEDKSVVTFSVQADPLKKYAAKFARSSNTLQESNRSMIAEFDFDNQEGALKAGMYAEVRLPIQRSKATLFVPKTSVIHSTEGVFLVKINNGDAEWVNIQQGNSLDSLVEVFGAIEAGEKIVKLANEELRNGQPLKSN